MKKILGSLALGLSMSIASNAGAIEQQHYTDWCWASATQEVLAERGIFQSQEQIAARLTGWPQNRPAYSSEIVGLLRSYGLPAFEAGRPGTPAETYQLLGRGARVIVLISPMAQGHFVVLEGYDPYGNIWVADPWTGNTSLVPLAAIYAMNWVDTVVTP